MALLALVVIAVAAVAVLRPDLARQAQIQAKQLAHLLDKTAEAVKPQAARRLVVWHAEDSTARRAWVDALRFDQFVNSVGGAIEADRVHMHELVTERLRLETSPLFAEMDNRVPAFLDGVFDRWTSYTLVVRGILVVGAETGRVDMGSMQTHLQGAINGQLMEQYRDVVLQPESGKTKAQAAMGRVFAALRRDLLTDCDKYDQAFQDFIRQEALTIERLDSGSGWQADSAWTPDNATFRSLCHTLRGIDSPLFAFEDPYYALLTQPGMPVEAAVSEVARPLVATIVGTAISASETAESLSGIGLSPEWAGPPAAALAMMTSSFRLADQVMARLDESTSRPNLEPGIRNAVTSAQGQFIGAVSTALGQFVDAQFADTKALIAPRPTEAAESR